MKILIFASGNIYEKEIAYAFQKAGIEYKFITTYPKFLIKKYFINKNIIMYSSLSNTHTSCLGLSSVV